MKLENFIAFRYIRYSGGNKDISSSAKSVILSIACAIIFYIAAASIMNGYIYGIMKLSFEVRSFHLAFKDISSYSEAESYRLLFNEDKRTIYTGLYRETSVLLSANSKNTVVGFFREIPEDIFTKDKGFDDCVSITSGTKSLLMNQIMISEKTASKLSVDIGDFIFLTAMTSENNGKLIIRKLSISGIFSTGLTDFDEQISFIGNKTGDKIFKDSLPYNVMIKINDYNKASEFSRDFLISGIPGLISWDYDNYNEITAVKFQKNVIAFIVILVIFVAALNILTTIHITIHEKSSDIGILKSIGWTPIKIMAVFIFNGIYLALMGIIPGIIIGLFIMFNLNSIMIISADIFNYCMLQIHSFTSLFFASPVPDVIEFFSKDFYLDKIYTSISFEELLFITFITMIFAVIASVTPSIKAGYIKPNEVLKNE
ncbi:MAG: hypothetical protein A2015_06485 [Spirochaetes bacterium GWF1_31_7]|nr:MAG: hypothetical protein A2Y30_08320 [Spirochaetes bacterium GWE1_32_154]OHD51392.1 MAG: hypothetical protein A2Y29_14705 [Spirochaetes bacterium GWE2_31_10]OHD53118.1 MAG: hypothetical protein A2015_06485 [Spirochaetes bacterium GWF1_31_7]OHD82261.1 MAG: hypothetical protein A2355_00985 [Spirochaetes bacterium RIFOXYB1_FULL_32_8]HBD94461.1 hypothetical protein [Spirochaetia bacterium]